MGATSPQAHQTGSAAKAPARFLHVSPRDTPAALCAAQQRPTNTASAPTSTSPKEGFCCTGPPSTPSHGRRGAPFSSGAPGLQQDSAGKWELTRSASRRPCC
ncbi:hypothetical protein NDU88_002599 [Pleurodeles waltl]|uniref:Uncharacterized protein n=1 Tax=Pleurodeles waltl TaxID=8319 RepID=A0AAV7Q9V2_PLEWA|nr:hypothetical protein NDU88_002599 [Pleurodeles waltl]